MRSVFIHIKGHDKQAVSTSLSQYCTYQETQRSEQWVHKGKLFIDFYEDHLLEYEEEDVEALKARLGMFPPDVTVAADLSGKIVGYAEAIQLARFLLTTFDGLVQDDGDGIWSLSELLKDLPSHGKYFMEDSRRYNGLIVPVDKTKA